MMTLTDTQAFLDSWFVFKEWSSFQTAPKREFENKLDEFGTFTVFADFVDFLERSGLDWTDEDGEKLDIDAIVKDQAAYTQFIDERMYVSPFYRLDYADIQKPFVYGTAHPVEPIDWFLPLDEVKSEADLLIFINEVLSDVDQVTHSSGVKNRYEAVGRAD